MTDKPESMKQEPVLITRIAVPESNVRVAQPQVSDYDREFWGDKPQGDFAAKIIAKALHYPECWDTAAYPTLDDAVIEAEAWDCHGCSVCKPQNHSGEATDMVQGEWVDLTDDEIHAAINEPTEDLEVMMWRANYCRAVIAAFKEKNK